MSKASRAAPWTNKQPWSDDDGRLTMQSLQWVNDVYNTVLAPNAPINTFIDNFNAAIPADSTAITVTDLRNDFNQLLANLRSIG